MTDNNERDTLIDSDIFDTNLDTAKPNTGAEDNDIPAFLRRNLAPATPTPVFAAQPDPHGQVELTVEEHDAVANDEPEPIETEDIDMPPSLDEMVERAARASADNMTTDELYSELTSTDDIALTTLDQLPAATTNTEIEQLQTEEVTPQGNDTSSNEGAFINNAPSQLAANQISNQPMSAEEMKREFFRDINKFGKQSGEGASALGRLGFRALRAAADGIISTAKPTGGGKDDATLIYEAYAAMDSKHSEHTAGGSKANASKLRQIIAMGCMTTLSDPVAIGNRVLRIHERMTDAELKPKAIFAALVDVARAQQASDTAELSDAEIEAQLTKTKADKTLEKEWEAVHKKVADLTSGEASHGLKDTSDTALKILELVEERVKQYKSNNTRADRISQMIEMGYTQAQAENIVDKKINV